MTVGKIFEFGFNGLVDYCFFLDCFFHKASYGLVHVAVKVGFNDFLGEFFEHLGGEVVEG